MGIHDVGRDTTSYITNKNSKMLRVDLFQSINGSKLLSLNKIVLYYRYLDDGISDSELALLNIWGLTHNNGIKSICCKIPLRCTKDSNGANKSDWTNTVISVENKECTGIIAEVEGIEKLFKIDFDGIFKRLIPSVTSIATGNCVWGTNVNELEIASFVIDNGSVYSYTGIVTLDNICVGTPTHYRASMNSSFVGAQWLPYSTSPLFNLRGSGVNRVYLQVKDEDKNLLSSVRHADIGWSGQLSFSLSEDVVVDDIVITEYIDIAINSTYDKAINEDVPISDVVVTDNVSIILEGV